MTYKFVVADYLVFASTICVCLGIGLYFAITGGKRQTTSDYLLGNRRLQMIPVALSLVVSFESSILMLGFPAEIYVYGVSILISQVSLLICICIGGAWIAAPLIHPLKITSFYEYMELRYNSRGPRLLCTAIGMLYYIFYMGIVLYGPAIALEAVVQFPIIYSILIVAFASVLYTAMGGIRAVVWTDVLQCVIMNIGMIAIIIQVSIFSGGFEKIWNTNKVYKRLDIHEPDPTIRHTVWSLLFGNAIRYLSVVFNQSTIQRISSVDTLQEAKMIFYISGPVFFIMGLLVCCEGLTTFTYFNIIQCDPLEANQISNPNQIVPYMVVRVFEHLPGMSGLFMAALFSASLSTISSGLSSLSAQLTEDFIKPYFKRVSDATAAVVAKLSVYNAEKSGTISHVLVFGAMAIGISIVIANTEGSLIQIAASLLASFSGPVSGIFLYSVFCPWATKQGAVIGGIMGMAITLWLSLGQTFSSTLVKQPWLPHNPVNQCSNNSFQSPQMNFTSFDLMDNSSWWFTSKNKIPTMGNYDDIIEEYWKWNPIGLDKLYALSYNWFATIALLTVVTTGTFVSIITGYPNAKDVDVRFVLPLGETLFPYLPKRAKIFLEFGVPFQKRTDWLSKVLDNDPADVTGDRKDSQNQPLNVVEESTL